MLAGGEIVMLAKDLGHGFAGSGLTRTWGSKRL
jgi:hypothetical protein